MQIILHIREKDVDGIQIDTEDNAKAICEAVKDFWNIESIEIKKETTKSKKKIGIVNVNLQYEIPENHEFKTDMGYIENVELPSEYVEDSFEIVKVIEQD